MRENDADYKVRRFERMKRQMRRGEVGVGNIDGWLEQQEVSCGGERVSWGVGDLAESCQEGGEERTLLQEEKMQFGFGHVQGEDVSKC